MALWEANKHIGMHFIVTWYAVISAASAGVSAFSGATAWRRRSMPGGASLAMLLSALSVWSLASAFEYAAVGVPLKVLCSKVEYIGVVSSPLFFLSFALEYNQYSHWLTKKHAALLSIVPIVTLGLAWTNERHGLIWSGFAPSSAGHNLLVYRHGSAYWIGVIGYDYAVTLIGTILLVWAMLRFPSQYRRQPAMLLTGLAVPWVGNLVYTLGLSPLPGLEPTPLLMTFSGLVYGFVIFRFGLLPLVPVAREALIETLPDGVLVLDMHRRVVDINPSARRLLSKDAGVVLGQSDEQVFANWPDLAARLSEAADMPLDVPLRGTGGRRMEVRMSPLIDRRGRATGSLVVLRDVTVRALAEEALRAANARLHAQLAQIETLQADLRDQAIRDPLTGLFNRRFLDDTLERELARAGRDNSPLSVVMLDVDHFKDINDTHGHKAGDIALAAMGAMLRSKSRLGDFACRYGGEEFVIIMPDTPLAIALLRAEEWRVTLREVGMTWQNQALYMTLSGGIAVFPRHGETSDALIHAADLALYAAKSAGRDRVLPGEEAGGQTNNAR